MFICPPRVELRIVLLYALSGMLWIFFSDYFFVTMQSAEWVKYHVYGELLLLALSALLIYLFLCRHYKARMLAEAQLRLQATALEAAANAIVLTDSNGTIEWINPAFSALTGYSREESIGVNLRDLVHTGFHDRSFYKSMWDTILGGQVWRGEIVNRRKDGTRYTEEQMITSVRGLDGAITHFVAIKQDITERKRAEENLRIKEYAIISANAIAMAGLDGNLTYVNPAFLQLWGYADESEVLGKASVDFWDVREQAQEIVTALQQVGRWTGELTAQRKDGTHFHVQISASMILDKDNQPLCMQAWFIDITQHKEAEEKIHFQARMLDAVDSAVIVTDLEGRVRYWNQAAERLYGWSAAETIGQSIVELTAAQQSLEQANEIMKRLRSGASWSGEFSVRRKDGTVFPAFVVDSPIADAQGNWAGIIGISTDISERKMREREMEAISAVSATLRPAITRAQVAPAILDQLLILLDVEGAMLVTFDPKSQETVVELGRGIWSSISNRFVPQDARLVMDVLRTGQPYLDNEAYLDPRLLRPDLLGDCRAIACAPVILEDQTTGLFWIASKRDLSDHDLHLLITVADLAASAIRRGALYDQTQAQAEQIDQLLRSVPDGVLLLDEGLRLVQINPAGRNYLDHLGGGRVDEILPKLGDRSLEDLLTSPATGSWHEIHRGTFTFEALARPLVAGPTTKGWVLVLRDVSRQREAQELLQRQERLAAVGQLAAGIAHDFNNLMGVIVLYTELLRLAPELSAKNQDRLQIIHNQARQASSLIEQILDFSRRSVIEKQPLDLKPLAKEQVKLLQRTLPENVEINLTWDTQEHTILADPTRIQQILMNLAINARDAMPNGGSLHIDLARVHIEPGQPRPIPDVHPGNWIRLSVSDTGVGIPPGVIEHIFEPFFTTKEPGKGTGLGLAQVYGIVGQHGGQIGVHSQDDEGTTFTIYLPALTGEVDDPAAAQQHLPQGNGELLLVVEDNQSLLSALAEYLQMWNYRSQTASNGEEAIRLLSTQEEVPALVLSDMVMPRMGGAAFLSSLRRRGYTMPVILLSGHPLDETEMSPLAAQGMVAWLPKPLDMSALAHSIASALH